MAGEREGHSPLSVAEILQESAIGNDELVNREMARDAKRGREILSTIRNSDIIFPDVGLPFDQRNQV